MIKNIFCLFILSTITICAQTKQFDRSSYYSFGQKLYAEAHSLPLENKDSIEVIVLFKALYESLIFIQANPLSNPGSFQAVPSVEIFFKDNNGIIKNRVFWSDTIWANSYDETKSKNNYASGFIKTRLAKTKYDCTIQLLDRYKMPAEKTELKLNQSELLSNNANIYSPIYTYSNSNLPIYKTIPFILSDKINFNTKNTRVLIPLEFDTKYDVFNYEVTKNNENSTSFWIDTVNITGRVSPTSDCTLDVEKNAKFPVVLSVKSSGESQSEERKIGVLSIDLPSSSLSPGSYNLVVSDDNNKSKVKYDFELVWVDMPLSLRTPSYAVELMYYILTDDEYAQMKSGSDEEKAQKVMQYWKKKDPTTHTPFNEAMTEYFSRADYAFFNFQTIQEKDGAKTERGKIYILYGKPDNVEKKFENEKQYEVWHYNKLKKVFYFELISNGIFVLTKIDE